MQSWEVLPYQRYSTKSKAFETTEGGAAVVISGSSKSAMFSRKKTSFMMA